MSDYETDVLAWSEEQAALLRRVAQGERVNEAALDWENIIDEIETVGRSELRSVESLLTQLLLHRLKIQGWPDSLAAKGWEKEARVFRRQLRRRYAPSMRNRLDLDDLYADAVDLLPEAIDGNPPRAIPTTCPWSLDELLAPA